MEGERYVPERSLGVAVYLALELGKPLFLEGEAGVGKTEVAKVLASILDTRFIRLQCYEGLDVNHAVYEWDYPKQMLAIRLIEAGGEGEQVEVDDIMGRDYLVSRPLLQAVEASADGERPVLLIDELDRADEEFEAYLLEYKPPGVAETLDWAAALAVLGTERLNPEVAEDTLGVILKYQEDIERVRSGGTQQLLASAG